MTLYSELRDTRTPDQIDADRLALPRFTPGARVRHTTYRTWHAAVLRTFVDAAGEWVEHQDDHGNIGAGRPRFWEVIVGEMR